MDSLIIVGKSPVTEIFADGEIEISINGGYDGEMVYRSFTIEELSEILESAIKHNRDYAEYVANKNIF